MADFSTLRFRIRTALHLDRALRIVWRFAAGWTSVNALLVIVQGLFPIAAFYLMKRIVDEVSVLLSSRAAPESDYGPLLLWIGLAAAVALGVALARSLGEYTGSAQSQILSDKVADILHERSIAVDLAYYENPDYYDTLHRAQEEAPFRLPRVVNGLMEIARSAIALTGIMALLYSFGGVLVLALLLATIPVAAIRLVFSQKVYDLDRSQTENERRAWYYHSVMTDISGAQELRVFDLGELFRRRYQKLRSAIRERRLDLYRSRALMDILAQLLVVGVLFASVAWIAFRTIGGERTLGDLVAFYLAFQGGLNYMQTVFRSFAALYEDNLFLSHLYEFLELKPGIAAPSNPEPLPETIEKGLVCNGLGFTYPGSREPVLSDINIEISPGQVVAIVGDNGSGKTTLVKLLCRLYDPTEGSITVDGSDLRRFDPAKWRKKIGVVFQDYAHYALSVTENIWLGNIGVPPHPEKIEKAAELSGAAPFIKKLPSAFDTQLGRWFTEGHEVSKGEWQKIALARAFWRDADVLVFDEPSSSLDPIAEDRLFSNFRKLIDGRSAILISHRFSTLRMADCIHVMRQGRIVESGTHDELLGRQGHYAELYNAQAKHYHGRTGRVG